MLYADFSNGNRIRERKDVVTGTEVSCSRFCFCDFFRTFSSVLFLRFLFFFLEVVVGARPTGVVVAFIYFPVELWRS